MVTPTVSVSVRFISRDSATPTNPRNEVADLFKASLALAHQQIAVDGIARCASYQATAVTSDELIHSPGCSADRVLKAWDAFLAKVRPKPATSVLSPISAA